MTIQINNQPSPSAEKRNEMFDHYVTPHIARIRQRVNQLTISGEDADDNLQDVLIQLLQAIALYNPEQPLLPWLMRVVSLRMISIHRHTATLPFTTSLDSREHRSTASDDYEGYTPDDDNEDDGYGNQYNGGNSRAALVPTLSPEPDDYPTTYAALMGLTAVQQRVLLFCSEGWTSSDIAKELRITPQAARVLLHRARQNFAAAYTPRTATPQSLPVIA